MDLDVTSYILGKQAGGSSGTTDYTDLSNKPSINDVTLSGNKTSSDLGIQEELVSGTNIKTINNQSILGSGDLQVSGYIGDLPVYIIPSVSNYIIDLEKPGIYLTQKDWQHISYILNGNTYHLLNNQYSGIVYGTPLIIAKKYSDTQANEYFINFIGRKSTQDNSEQVENWNIMKAYDGTLDNYRNTHYNGCIQQYGTATQTIYNKFDFKRYVPEYTGSGAIQYDTHLTTKKYVDDLPTTYTGYDATKTQVLKNINGTLTWVDE